MKIEGYEEISEREYLDKKDRKDAFFLDRETDKNYYFKKVQKFPIVFDLGFRHNIDVSEDGEMEFKVDNEIGFIVLPKEIPLLIKAVEQAKEIMKKKC